MKLIYNGPKDREDYSKIGAIKIVRNHAGLDLKIAKNVVEEAVEKGWVEFTRVPHKAPPIQMLSMNKALLDLGTAGVFSVTSTFDELYDTVELAIQMAVNIRMYETAEVLISTLPEERKVITFE